MELAQDVIHPSPPRRIGHEPPQRLQFLDAFALSRRHHLPILLLVQDHPAQPHVLTSSEAHWPRRLHQYRLAS